VEWRGGNAELGLRVLGQRREGRTSLGYGSLGEKRERKSQALRPKQGGRRTGPSGQKADGKVFLLLFFSKPLKTILKISLKLWSKTIHLKNQMHQHEYTQILLSLMINFNLMKNIIFPMFLRAQIYTIKSIYIYFERSKF